MKEEYLEDSCWLSASVLNQMSQTESHLLVVQFAVCQRSPAEHTIAFRYHLSMFFSGVNLAMITWCQC